MIFAVSRIHTSGIHTAVLHTFLIWKGLGGTFNMKTTLVLHREGLLTPLASIHAAPLSRAGC